MQMKALADSEDLCYKYNVAKTRKFPAGPLGFVYLKLPMNPIFSSVHKGAGMA